MSDRYDTSELRAELPLSEDDVQAVVTSQGRLIADRAAALHFARRVLATMGRQREVVAGLGRDMELLNQRFRDERAPLTRALHALGDLDDEQRAQVFDMVVQQRLAAVEVERERAQRAATAAANEGNRVRFAVAVLESDPSLPVDVRQRIRSLLDTLPTPAVPSSGSTPTTGPSAAPVLSPATVPGDVERPQPPAVAMQQPAVPQVPPAAAPASLSSLFD